ncbi:MAG: type II toxin-antitoxin system VapC family toxin [Microcoleaceae cyanobacterium]
MTIKYLLDTNIFSEVQRPQPNVNVMTKLQLNYQEISTTSIVIHELLFGCLRLPESKKRQYLKDYIENVIIAQVKIFDYSSEAAEWHAKERARLMQIGKTPAFVDGQIASVAAVNNLVLVTNNIADFLDFQGLTIENWFI